MPTHEELVSRKNARIQELHRMDPKRTALLVIDMQRSFMDPASSLVCPDIVGDPAAGEGADRVLPGRARPGRSSRSSSPLPEIPTLSKDPFGPEHLAARPGEPTGWGLPSGNSLSGPGGASHPTRSMR